MKVQRHAVVTVDILFIYLFIYFKQMTKGDLRH